MAPLTSVTFGDLLKQLRKRAGMTQADLAAAVGYSVPFISNLELNQRLPTVEVVVQSLVPALGLQEEPHLAARLIELAAVARGQLLPAFNVPQSARHSHAFQEKQEKVVHSAIVPLPPTEILGRAQEVKEICNRLLGHRGRLLTLTGAPGIGKTRLGLAVLEKLQAIFRDGVYFIPLAAIEDADLVAATLLAGIGIDGEDKRVPNARLIDFLRRKETLLLLDNFEQIAAAAPLVAELLAACPEVRVLVTSRERLHLRAEQRYRVPPLDVESAVALFVERAQAVTADFVLTADNHPTLSQICRMLDCLPLAIELSAAHLDFFTPEGLLARLHDQRLDLLGDGAFDLPAHQRTLRNAIHRSYVLLNEEEQRLFRGLAVFGGGFGAEALNAVGGSEATLHALVHKSLVQVVARPDRIQRFQLLETLREYAWEQLGMQGETVAMQQRHAELYLQLAEEAARHLRDPSQAGWLEQLALEHANLRAALGSSFARGQMDVAVRLGIALWRFWYVRGFYEEGAQWLAQLLGQEVEAAPRAKLLYGQGMLARRRGDLVAAGVHLAASLAIYRALNDARGIASALRGLGFVRYVQNDLDGARPLFDEALALFRALDDVEGVAATLDSLGYITEGLEDYQRLFEESLALRRRSGNLRGITMSLAGLVISAIRQEDYGAARRYLQEHLQINQELGNLNGIATAILMMGNIASCEGRYAEALSAFEKCVKLCRESHDRLLLPGAIQKLCFIRVFCGDYEGVAQLLEESLFILQEQGKVASAAEVLTVCARLALVEGLAERSLCLASAAVTFCAVLSQRLFSPQFAEFERTQAAARQMLSPGVAEAAWDAGATMTFDQAIAFALARPLC